MEIDQEILDEFHTEADESLDTLEQDLIKLESVAEEGTTDAELVDRIFRVLHTLKGGAGFLGLDKMNKLAHAGENLLDEVRGGHVAVTTEVMNALLETNDNLKELLTCSKTGESPDSVDFSALLERLEYLSNPKATPTPKAKETASPQNTAVQDAAIIEEHPAVVPETSEETAPPAAVEGANSAINTDLLAEVMGDDRLAGGGNDDEDSETPAAPQAAEVEPPAAENPAINADLLAEVMGDGRLAGSGNDDEDEAPTPQKTAQPVTATPVSAQQARAPQPAAPAAQTAAQQQARREAAETKEVTIRVDTARLDAVMNLVGELVLARNGLHRQMFREDVRSRLSGSSYLSSIDSGLEALTRVSKALQMSVLHTRMQPIKRVFDKIPRQVRELKNRLNKEIELIIEGEGTEVDRSLVEELADPMVHLIRNALDHGLEGPEEREKEGKDRVGMLVVRAFYEGNNVVIQVADDGRGINTTIVKNKAIEKGLITAEQASQMSETQAQRLIMAPGFSTAKEVSDVSGRGVGMDVVNNKIAKINGTIELESELGRGTTVSIYLPLTLAIVQALIVGANNEGFAIPIGSISEVIKFNPDAVHNVNSEDVIELRKEVVPIRYLAELTRKGKRLYVPTEVKEEIAKQSATGTKDKAISKKTTVEKRTDEAEKTGKLKEKDKDKGKRASSSTGGYIIIVRDSNMIMGLVVDELIGQEEAVVKSITDAFEFNPAISGATISGDGHVHMILDVPYFMRETVKNKR